MSKCYSNYMKTCIKCNQIKNRDNFQTDRNVCRECRNKQRQLNEKKNYEVTLTEKICKKCNSLKQASKFNVDKTRIGGLHCYCNECRSLHNKNKYVKNSEIIKKQTSLYYYTNKPIIQKKANEYNKLRRKLDPKFLITRRLKNRLWCALNSKGWNKNNKFVQYIGCSQEELKLHIEKQFALGMNWENSGEWHIDHIIPLSSAKTREEMHKLCHYTNLQPLWAIDNIKKSNKL